MAEISSGTVDPAKDTATPTPSLNQGQDWLPEKDREEPAQSGVPYSVNAFSGENDELGYTPAIDVPPAQDPETVSQLSGSRPGNKVGRRRERKVLLTAGLLGAVIGLGVLLALFTTLSQRACNQGHLLSVCLWQLTGTHPVCWLALKRQPSFVQRTRDGSVY